MAERNRGGNQMSNKDKKYKDRHADERLIVYYLKRCSVEKLNRILSKIGVL